jgi:RAD50-interacting protein 1
MATTSRAREHRERKGDRSPLAILLDPKTDIPLGERDIRVEDYLNDKIQTATDFENLDRLIASVEAQKLQLEDQVGVE